MVSMLSTHALSYPPSPEKEMTDYRKVMEQESSDIAKIVGLDMPIIVPSDGVRSEHFICQIESVRE